MNPLIPSLKLLTPEVLENTPEPVLLVIAEFTEAVEKLQKRVEHLEARLNQNSNNSNKPPSSDNPFLKTPEKS